MYTFLLSGFSKREERGEKKKAQGRAGKEKGGEGRKERFSLENYSGIFPLQLSFTPPLDTATIKLKLVLAVISELLTFSGCPDFRRTCGGNAGLC